MEASASAKARVDPRVVMTAYHMVYNEVSKLCACGVYLCVGLPVKTLRLCWQAQLYVVGLPFRLTRKVFCYLQHRLTPCSHKDHHMKLLENFLECNVSERKRLLRAMREFRAGSLVAVRKMNDLNRELGRCRKQLTVWKKQASRQTKEMADMANEEKKLLKVVISALRRLKTLKSSRESIDDKLKSTMDDLLNFARNLSSKELPESSPDGQVQEINAVLKAGYCRLQKQTEQMRVLMEKKRKIANACSNENLEMPFILRSNSKCFNLESGSSQNLLNLSMGTLDTIIGLLNAENLQLKKRLKVTNDQLDDVKNTSLSLNEKIMHLELQLEDVMSLLKSVEADRDDMRGKLLTLQTMIEEEEIFLNDDASGDDSCGELYVTTKDFCSEEFESSSPLDDIFYNESDEDAKESKSLELSLSR